MAYRLFSRARSADGLVFGLILVCGLASGVLMNDTLAVIDTPLVLRLATEHRLNHRLVLLALALAITIGSVMGPVGNPQNLLNAVGSDLPGPLATFLGALGPPTSVNLVIAYGVLRLAYRTRFHAFPLVYRPVTVRDAALARITRFALSIIVIAISAKLLLVGTPYAAYMRLSYIAMVAAAHLLLISSARLRLVRNVDWTTLIFFASMFVLMVTVWNSDLIQRWLVESASKLSGMTAVMGIGLPGSELVSNVPLVALYLPLLQSGDASVPVLMTLAAGSTIAGNLLLLGAASNVIIVQRAERSGAVSTFRQFAAVGVPLALLNAVVYLSYLNWLYSPGG